MERIFRCRFDESAAAQLKKLQKVARTQTTVGTVNESYKNRFLEALCDDLNTARALALVWELLGDTTLAQEDIWATILIFDEVLGLDLKNTPQLVISEEAKKLLEQRNHARAQKDFVTSDALRKELESLGYEVIDTSEGTQLG
jgi:cysteinyl-tRNA synthetase